MKVKSSYCVEIKHADKKAFRDTMDTYNDAIAFIMPVVEEHWDEISLLKPKEQQMAVEALIHTTKSHEAVYDFDTAFPMMPSYLRRSAIMKAVGHVSSYHSAYENWKAQGQKNNPPKLPSVCHDMPSFYRDNMYKEDKNGIPMVKVWKDNTWKYIPVSLKKTDMNYIRRHFVHAKMSAPTLVKKHTKWFLCFCMEEEGRPFPDKDILDRTICSVDLGINNDAVCSIMCSDGTILDRKFIDFPCDKDQNWHRLNRIKKVQKQYGPANTSSLWNLVKRHNDEHAIRIAKAIVQFAVDHDVDVIVFEHLDMKKKKSRWSKRQRLNLWRKNGIQDMVEHTAHVYGIRIARVCAWGTSRLAFDGSGEVSRDAHNHSLCTFSNGKQYNCDLSASYNIGARYFIREIFKTCTEKRRSLLQAKVPDSERRTENTLSTLLRLNKAMACV